jgi:hypothetical protein
MDKNVFFSQFLGLHDLLKLLVALENTVWCAGCWLPICSMKTSFFLAPAYWQQQI